MSATDLSALRLDIPRARILGRLRYREAGTASPELLRRVDRMMQEAAALCARHARVSVLPVLIEGDALRIGRWEPFRSASLAVLLRESPEVAIMAASIGSDLPGVTREAMERGDMTRAVVLDATGSEMAEALAHAAWLHVRTGLAPRGKTLTRRFSPGYGDVPLSLNREFYAALGLADWGVTLTERHMFVPEKTTVNISGVTARLSDALSAGEES